MVNFNEHFFHTIDSEIKAYWLGFITADGNLRTKPSFLMRINLAGKDYDHLAAFAAHINLNRSPRKYMVGKHECVSLALGSKLLGIDLLTHGIIPRKSLLVKPAITVPQEFITAYWRGCFDGDGSVGIIKAKNALKITFTGNEYMIKGFKDFLTSRGIHGGSISNHSAVMRFSTAGNALPLSITDLLYDGSTVYLPRKRAIVDSFREINVTDHSKEA